MNRKNIPKNNIMTDIFKEMLFIQIMAVITATIGSVVDGIVIGNFLGREAMAAFSIASPFFVFLSCFSNMVGNGAQSLGGRQLGRGDKDALNGTFSLTVLTVIIFGLIVFLIAYIFNGQIAVLLGADEHTKSDVADYIKGLSYGVLPIMLNGPIMRFLQLDKAQKFSFLGVVVMTVTDICGDLLNVFVFKKGMLGMAAATSVGYYSAVLLLVLHFFGKNAELKFETAKIRVGELKDIIVIGLPTAIGQVCTVLKTLCLNRIFLALAGTMFVAAFAGQNTISTLLVSVSVGFGMTTLLICSVLTGEEDRTSLVLTLKDSLKFSVLINAIIAVLVIIFADFLASLFGKGDIEIRTLSARILRIYALSLPINIINVNLQNFFQSMKKTVLVNVICVFNNFGFAVLFALILPLIAGRDSVWFMFPLAQTATLIMIILISAVHNRGIPKSFEDFLMLDSDFGVLEDNRLDIAIDDKDMVVGVSEEIVSFCKDHGVDKRRSNLSGLAVEEMAGNIVKHGFENIKKDLIEIRVAYKDDTIRIRIRDNCKAFNPPDHIRMLDDEDMTHNIGIRMVSKTARSFNYQSTFKLNILTIEM
ncbi:MAG: ATP-binding protein [Lachnospiraceae bacterium]|nr:ATP-binding protein [Lachnospiraceae bacterium]